MARWAPTSSSCQLAWRIPLEFCFGDQRSLRFPWVVLQLRGGTAFSLIQRPSQSSSSPPPPPSALDPFTLQPRHSPWGQFRPGHASPAGQTPGASEGTAAPSPPGVFSPRTSPGFDCSKSAAAPPGAPEEVNEALHWAPRSDPPGGEALGTQPRHLTPAPRRSPPAPSGVRPAGGEERHQSTGDDFRRRRRTEVPTVAVLYGEAPLPCNPRAGDGRQGAALSREWRRAIGRTGPNYSSGS